MPTILLGLGVIIAAVILIMLFTEMIVFVMTHVPFVPSARADIQDVVRRLPITSQDYVYDLGSGNGKVVFAIEKMSGASVKGFQLAGWTHWYAHIKKFVIGSSAELVGDNFFKHSWHDATVIYAYLYPFLMHDVGVKVLADCKPGTKVLARDFIIPNLPLYEEWTTPTGHMMRLYIVE